MFSRLLRFGPTGTSKRGYLFAVSISAVPPPADSPVAAAGGRPIVLRMDPGKYSDSPHAVSGAFELLPAPHGTTDFSMTLQIATDDAEQGSSAKPEAAPAPALAPASESESTGMGRSRTMGEILSSTLNLPSVAPSSSESRPSATARPLPPQVQ